MIHASCSTFIIRYPLLLCRHSENAAFPTQRGAERGETAALRQGGSCPPPPLLFVLYDPRKVMNEINLSECINPDFLVLVKRGRAATRLSRQQTTIRNCLYP